MHHQKTAYTLARLPIGFSFLGHGIVRIPKLALFAQGMAGSFQETLLPSDVALVFAYLLPFIELLLGIFLLLGMMMRRTSTAGVALMCVLIIGSSLQENWSGVAIQMFYGLYFVLLYLFSGHNRFLIKFNQKSNNGFKANQ